MLYLQLIFILFLLLIFYQDFKNRSVVLYLFLLGVISGGVLHYKNSLLEEFLINVLLNVGFIAVLTVVLFLYSTFIMKKKLLETIGVGDFLMFIVFACSFPIGTFLVVFSTSLIFSLLLFLILKNQLQYKTVPLAGFQSLFLSLLLLLNWLFNIVDIYVI
ncbi:hypothetical protein SAMN04487765_1287 [Tenacibaculum sp. MAR_2010_89]|nr:hypothetical protein SAMN04487765_1287 [Tenacibaculum sp. MAR_2010_89]